MEHPRLSLLLQIAMCVVFYAVGRTYSDDSVNLLVACNDYALLYNSTNPKNVKQIGPKNTTARRVDYHYSKNLLVAHVDGKLFRSTLFETGTPQQPSLVLEVGECPAFAVDWIHDLIYWANYSKYETNISAIDLEGNNPRNVVHWTKAKRIADIAVDPCSGLMFWIRDNEVIEFSDTSGQHIRRMHESPSKTVQEITLDILTQRLFYIEKTGIDPKVFSINYSNEYKKKHYFPTIGYTFFGFSFNKGFFYWTVSQLHLNFVYKTSLNSFDLLNINTFSDKNAQDLKVVDPELQPNAGSCPVKSLDDKSNSEHPVTLLIGSSKNVRKYNTTDMRNPHQLYVSKNAIPYDEVRVDFHLGKKLLFTHTDGNLYRSPLIETPHRPSLVIELGRCPAFAVDWIHDSIYWANCSRSKTSISVMDLHGNNSTGILDLTTKYFKYISHMAIDPCTESLFWIRNDVIESSDTKGQNFRTNIATKNTVMVITLDIQNQKLFYVDLKEGERTLFSIDYHGDQITRYFRRHAISGKFGLAVYKGFTYWVEYTVDDDVHTLYKASLNGFGFEDITSYHNNRIADLKVMAQDLQLDSNQCSNNKTSVTSGTVAK